MRRVMNRILERNIVAIERISEFIVRKFIGMVKISARVIVINKFRVGEPLFWLIN